MLYCHSRPFVPNSGYFLIHLTVDFDETNRTRPSIKEDALLPAYAIIDLLPSPFGAFANVQQLLSDLEIGDTAESPPACYALMTIKLRIATVPATNYLKYSARHLVHPGREPHPSEYRSSIISSLYRFRKPQIVDPDISTTKVASTESSSYLKF